MRREGRLGDVLDVLVAARVVAREGECADLVDLLSTGDCLCELLDARCLGELAALPGRQVALEYLVDLLWG